MPFLGEFSALLTAVLWSFTSIAFSHAAVKIGSIQLNMNRLLLATFFLLLTIIIFNIGYHLSYNQVLNLSISGIIGLVIGDTFLFKAYRQIGANLSILLMSFAPGLSAIMGYIFLAEGISFLGITGMAVTLMGIILVVTENKSPDAKYKMTPIGFFNGFMGAAGQAGGLVFAKLAFDQGDINGFVATFIRIFSSVIIFLPILLIFRKFKNPITTYKKNTRALASTIGGTVFGPYLGITFSMVAVANTNVGIACTLMSTMPVLMLPLVKYIYKEKLSWRAIIGAFITVIGVGILFLR
ncbi:MAG: DMT family transporter [Ignavibacteriaceae bacterium]|nr:DMT family transporter [Ignavibacteriaceae bacterium]